MKTCIDCIFSCLAGDLEVCERFKDVSYFVKNTESKSSSDGKFEVNE